MAKARITKRKVDLISSHTDSEDDEGPFLMCHTEEQDPPTRTRAFLTTGTGIEGWSSNDNLPPHRLPLRLAPGEHLIEYEEHFPDE